ncbi:hypothetical protein FCK90_02990 [Kocuria coralli]|uniref:Uncharacterized protein n=1 Tax=Kocuria coralli TaxID=1461025 RepID=A0A5J5L0J6_9MICC|nr:hypothetical protein [Kocuria coralli]KAA9395382.1 hypothetical protein FCK90_02990 [Kocuria coralli]
MTSDSAVPHGPEDTPLPEWGRLRPPGSTPPPPPGNPDSADSRPDPPEAVAARRRAARGLSFALIMLGVLVGFGLAALGHPLIGLTGLAPALAGAAGFLAVHLGIPRSLRLPETSRHRPGRSWWLLPASLLALGLAALSAVFVTAGEPGPGNPWTILWLVTAATLLTAAALGFGLVAASRLSVPDDDDAPLRRVDWSEEYPRRYESRPRGPAGPYDSSWLTGRPHPPRSRRKGGHGDPEDV